MLGVQYCFMATIHYGNAAVATLLQYLGPVIIILYLVATKVINFKWKEGIAVTLALSGTFLLLTNGSLATLSVPMPAIVWGCYQRLLWPLHNLPCAASSKMGNC